MNSENLSRKSRPGVALVGLCSILILMTGCAAYDDLAHGRSETSFASAPAFQREGGTEVAWLPDDATQITHVTSTRAEHTKSIVFSSDEELSGCETTDRTSLPTMEVSGGIDVLAISQVFVCGDWAVAEDNGEFYAWMPATESSPR